MWPNNLHAASCPSPSAGRAHKKGIVRAPTDNISRDIFQILRDGQPRTRAELVIETGLSRSTIGLRLDSLLESGLVSPVSLAVSTGGRPSAQIALNPDARLIVAADLGASHATVAITNLVGVVLANIHHAMPIASGPENVLTWLAETCRTLLAEIERRHDDVAAIGIGLPGPVEHTTGKPSHPPIMPGWDGFDVPGYLQEHFRVPVLVDNDVNIMALGERASRWPEVDDLIFLKIATGIGAGIISSGTLQRGSRGIAGDIGHIPLQRGAGVLCNCGNEGCLEAIAGGRAIAAGLRSAGSEAHTGSDVVALVKAGDPAAIQAVRQAGRDIGEVLNMCVSILNPSVIVVGGSMAPVADQLIAGIREVVYARAQPLATHHLTIAQSYAGSESAVLGAALMAADFALSPEYVDVLIAPRLLQEV
jgi:predicted NBD/HSP70 family sugar kinase